MTGRIALGACLAILITAPWNIQSLAQQAVPQGQAARAATSVATPCLGRENSVECAIYRLDQVDRRLNDIETSIRDLQSRPARAMPSGPPINHIKDPGGKSDASSEYLSSALTRSRRS